MHEAAPETPDTALTETVAALDSGDEFAVAEDDWTDDEMDDDAPTVDPPDEIIDDAQTFDDLPDEVVGELLA